MKNDMSARMATAATRRTSTDTPDVGKTAIRTKRVRITVDLEPSVYAELNKWIQETAITIDPDAVPFLRLSQSDVIRAMIKATLTDSTAVLNILKN